jgi:hypothetical protein
VGPVFSTGPVSDAGGYVTQYRDCVYYYVIMQQLLVTDRVIESTLAAEKC